MLTRRQEEILLGTLLGDGFLENRGTANSRLQIRHSIKQKEYVDWLYKELANLTLSIPREIGNAYFFRSKSLPLFTTWRKRFYLNGFKIVPKDIFLSPLSLAIWFMDDGYCDKKAAYFCTHSFNQEDLNHLQKLLSNYNLKSSFIADRGHYKIRLVVGSTPTFIELVKPFIHPSLLYKLE
mgnify:FL=1